MFLIFNLILPPQLKAISSGPLTADMAEGTGPIPLQPPARKLYRARRSLLISWRLNNPGSLNHSSYDKFSKPLTSLGALHWAHSGTSMSFLKRGAQTCRQNSRCGFTHAEYRGRSLPWSCWPNYSCYRYKEKPERRWWDGRSSSSPLLEQPGGELR